MAVPRFYLPTERGLRLTMRQNRFFVVVYTLIKQMKVLKLKVHHQHVLYVSDDCAAPEDVPSAVSKVTSQSGSPIVKTVQSLENRFPEVQLSLLVNFQTTE